MENTTSPLASAVRLGSSGCTAVKIANNRFLTAAHCINESTSTVQITNSVTGTGAVSYSIPAGHVWVHPSFQLGNSAPAGEIIDNVQRLYAKNLQRSRARESAERRSCGGNGMLPPAPTVHAPLSNTSH